VFYAMSTPESTSALEAFRLRLIGDLNEAFEEFVSALDPDFIASLGSAASLCEPALEASSDRTSAPEARLALLKGWPEIGSRLAARPHVGISQLCMQIEPHIEGGLRDGDLHQTDSSHTPWNSAVGNAVRVWPVAEYGPPLVESVGRNKWRVTEYGRSIL